MLPRVDYCLDLHSGGYVGPALGLAGYCDIAGEYGKKSFGLAQMFPIEVLWRLPIGPSPKPIGASSFAEAAYEKGVPFFNGEVLTGQIEIYVTGLKNVLKNLNMIEGQPEAIPRERKHIDSNIFMYAESKAGLFFPRKNPGELISKDEVIGAVTDIFGNKLEEIKAPFDGIVTQMRNKSIVWLKDVVCCVAKLTETPNY